MTAFDHVLRLLDRSFCTMGDIEVMNRHWEWVYYHRISQIEEIRFTRISNTRMCWECSIDLQWCIQMFENRSQKNKKIALKLVEENWGRDVCRLPGRSRCKWSQRKDSMGLIQDNGLSCIIARAAQFGSILRGFSHNPGSEEAGNENFLGHWQKKIFPHGKMIRRKCACT